MPSETPFPVETSPAVKGENGADASAEQVAAAGGDSAPTPAALTAAKPLQISLLRWRRMWPFRKQASAWFTSATLHATLLVLMCLLAEHVIKQLVPVNLDVHTVNHDEPLLVNLSNDSPAAGPNSRLGPPGAATADPNGAIFGSGLEDSPIGIPDLGASPTVGVKIDVQPRVDPLANTLLPPGGGVAWGQALSKGGGGMGGRSPERRAAIGWFRRWISRQRRGRRARPEMVAGSSTSRWKLELQLRWAAV